MLPLSQPLSCPPPARRLWGARTGEAVLGQWAEVGAGQAPVPWLCTWQASSLKQRCPHPLGWARMTGKALHLPGAFWSQVTESGLGLPWKRPEGHLLTHNSKKSRGGKGLWDGWALGLRGCDTNVCLSVCPLPPVFLGLFLCLQLKVGFPHTMGELGVDKDGASCPIPASDPRRKRMAPLNMCV